MLYQFKGFCKPDFCADADYTRVPVTRKDGSSGNQELCDRIKKYGLTSTPTGDLFNQAYPDTQDTSLPSIFMYPNQESAPEDGKGKGKGKDKGKDEGKDEGKDKGKDAGKKPWEKRRLGATNNED